MVEDVRVPALPERKPEDHKGTFGHLLVLAGSPRMTGAALLVTRAALRSGAGLVTLGMPRAIHPLVAPSMLCAMSFPLPSSAVGTFSREAVQPALDFATGVDAVALGPGISTENETVAFATRVAQKVRVPLVIDADGLNCLAKSPATLRGASSPRVLTPHPGEAARLLGTDPRRVQSDRVGTAGALAQKFGAVVVLKGHGTVVSDGERVFTNDTGNPGMATGGTGDVLTGVLGALLAGGMATFEATVLAVHVHGLAGDLAAERLGQTSLTAEDLIAFLPAAFLGHAG